MKEQSYWMYMVSLPCSSPTMAKGAETQDYLFKFIVIGKCILLEGVGISWLEGEAGTGKSCLLYHCINEACQSLTSPSRSRTDWTVKEHSAHTIGVEFSSRTLRIGDRNIKLQVSTMSLWFWLKLTCSYGIQRDKRDSDQSLGLITVRQLLSSGHFNKLIVQEEQQVLS